MAARDVVAEVRGATKTYGAITALDGVDFRIGRGEVRALLGKNGAGKSTLIRLLSGVEEPDSGDVFVGGEPLGGGGVEAAHRLGARTVHQELSLIGSMTVAENMFMGHWPSGAVGLDHRKMYEQTRIALARLDLRIDPGRVVEELSVADQQLVEIARAIHDEPRLLILDEPTSSLASAEVDRVLGVVRTIAETGVAVIYVSHRLNEIRQIAQEASIMRDGRMIDTRSLADAGTHEIVQMMVGAAVDGREFETRAIDQTQVVLEAEDIRAEPHLHGVSLQLRRGEVLGIAGVLGSGRSELLRILAGIDAPEAGAVSVGAHEITGGGLRRALRCGIGITPENRKEEGIFPDLGVDENMVVSDWARVSKGGFLSPSRIAAAARSLIDKLSVKTRSASAEISTLSGGNQQKVVIGRWLHAESTILLLDEPTRGVDVEAKAQIYELVRELAGSGRSVIFVSSELEELPAVCDRVVVLRGGRIVEEHTAPGITADAVLASAMAEQ